MDILKETNGELTEKKVHVDHNIIVDMEKVSKIFDKNTWAVKKINLQIKKGECIALIGANGAGKSTVGRLIANVIKQTSGIVDYYFKEENIFKAIGYQSKEQQWPNGFKVSDVIELWVNIYNVQDKEWISKMMDIFGIENIKNKYLSKLSSVPLQLFAIFLAILYKPELLVIDDLSSNIDFERRNKILELFKEYIAEGNTIVLVYPDDYFLSNVANRVVYVQNGQISEDLTIKEIKNEYETVQKFIKKVVTDEERIKSKIKPDPFFNPIIKNFDLLIKQLEDDYSQYFENELTENYFQFDLNIKNTIFYINELRRELDEIATSILIKASVDKIKKSIKKTKKSISIILKEIDLIKKQDHDIKHMTKLERDFYRINQFIAGKLNDIFKNDKLIINGDEMEIEMPNDDKKQLKLLKERYIKEELKIIRLERRRINQRESILIPKRLLRDLSPVEKRAIEEAVNIDSFASEEGITKISVLDNNKILLKNKKQIADKDVLLIDTKKTNAKFVNSFYDDDDNETFANTIYYDNTVEASGKIKLTNEKRKLIDKLLKSRKKGDQ